MIFVSLMIQTEPLFYRLHSSSCCELSCQRCYWWWMGDGSLKMNYLLAVLVNELAFLVSLFLLEVTIMYHRKEEDQIQSKMDLNVIVT